MACGGGSSSVFKRALNAAVERSFESEHFVAEVKALNKKIFDYNLLVPVIQFQRRLLNVHVELESMFQILKTNSSID